MIFTIYLTISLLCIFLVLLDMTLRKIGLLVTPDVFVILNKLNDMINDIEDDKVRNFISNLSSNILLNPIYCMMLIVTLSFIPIVNIIYLKTLLEGFYKEIKGID